jgi:mRNA interferase MazF
VVKRAYVPDRGDLVWVSLEPHLGREQAGRRPALVLSPKSYNAATGLMVACPITSRAKGYPFEVPVTVGKDAPGVVLADHVKSLDWRERRVGPAGRAPPVIVAAVQARLRALSGM